MPRWKLWLTTVHVLVTHRPPQRVDVGVFAEYRSQSGACPCGLLDSVFLTTADVRRAWLLAGGVVREPAGEGEVGGDARAVLPHGDANAGAVEAGAVRGI